MKKNLLALSIAAMVGGIAGGANAQIVTSTPSDPATLHTQTGGRLAASNFPFGRLAAANAAGTNAANVPPSATVFEINTKGTGHALFVPYFTTQGDNASLLNIVNTDTENGKAVKLRYRGAANSDDLFDITIYLSPGDVWAANVAVNENGFSRLVTSDKSCTLPSAVDIAKDGSNTKEGGQFKIDRVGSAGAAATREGYIEILNMADIPSRRTRNVATESDLYTAVKHVNGVAPCRDAVMSLQENPLVANDIVDDPATRGYSWPTGGLAANWTIVNVADKASFSGEAVAVQARVAAGGANGAGNLVWSPQTTAPVSQATAGMLSADPLLSGVLNAQGQLQAAGVRASNFDFPDLSTPYTINALFPSAQSAILANALTTRAVSNEYLTNPAVAFATDWVFSMPTRRYSVAVNYATKQIVANDVLGVTKFVTTGATTNTYLNAAGDRICVNTNGGRAWDREENTKTTFVISPNPTIDLCGEVSVLSFNSDTSAVLGAKLTQLAVKNDYLDGWFRIATPGVFNRGLPVIGFAAAKARGSNLGGTWEHRYE